MKSILPLLLIAITISINGMGQSDTLQSERFMEDSVGRSYEIQYRYAEPRVDAIIVDSNGSRPSHAHYISLVNIIAFKGNKQKVIFSNIKAIYSPVDCVADNRELWLKRLYQYQNGKK